MRRKIFSLSLRRGVVTERYPFAPIEVPEDFRGKPEIDPEKCIGCGACANVCPPEAIKVRDLQEGYREISLFLGRCIFCGRCEEVCPVEAIKLSKEFELASLSKEDLYQVIRLKMVKCVKCGRYFDTVRHLLFLYGLLEGEKEKLLLLCPECKRKREVGELLFSRGLISRRDLSFLICLFSFCFRRSLNELMKIPQKFVNLKV